MQFHIVTIFPEIFDSFLSTSLIGKAIKEGTVKVDLVDPRAFATDRHRTVDDTPYGGGEGMVLKPEPVVAAIESIVPSSGSGADVAPHRLLLSPQGRPLHQTDLRRLARMPHLVLICGRYEGFDERISAYVDAELSLGDFVLNGGEVAAMAIVDGVSRLVPGVIGNQASLADESHERGLLNYPQYTRPREFRSQPVPDVLLGGDHEKIRRWRRLQMLVRTRARRPDLWSRVQLDESDHELLKEEAGPAGGELSSRTYVALLHHPVYDRDERVVTTSLTNLDLHDIARSGRTYGLAGYFIVTPIDSQRELAERILSHWQQGHGASYHAKRAEALRLVRVASDLEQTVRCVADEHGAAPRVVATSARSTEKTITYSSLRDACADGRPLLVLLGTGWGLTEELLAGVDAVLPPVRGPSDYNHLSVRSAAAIILDRLFGMRE